MRMRSQVLVSGTGSGIVLGAPLRGAPEPAFGTPDWAGRCGGLSRSSMLRGKLAHA
jgi:hypothetical protein